MEEILAQSFSATVYWYNLIMQLMTNNLCLKFKKNKSKWNSLLSHTYHHNDLVNKKATWKKKKFKKLILIPVIDISSYEKQTR